MSVYPNSHISRLHSSSKSDMDAMLDAYRQAGGNPEDLRLPEVATLIVSAGEVLGSHEVPGIHFHAEPIENGIKARIEVEPDAIIKNPVHMCFGVIPEEGIQKIVAEFKIGDGAQVEFRAHCSFPNAVKVQHLMDAQLNIGRGAILKYSEEHFHGPTGGIEVRPKAVVTVAEGGCFITDFSLTRGRIGILDLDYHIQAEKDSVVEMTAKAYGKESDQITVREVVKLNGDGARGLTKTRVAVRNDAMSHIYTTMEGNAPGARGHMDCTEIVRDQAEASNTPVVIVRNDQAQVTHEAAIGTVNRKELESLLARGLDEDEAVDLIIRGMIR